jgi:hypothetical protein
LWGIEVMWALKIRTFILEEANTRVEGKSLELNLPLLREKRKESEAGE